MPPFIPFSVYFPHQQPYCSLIQVGMYPQPLCYAKAPIYQTTDIQTYHSDVNKDICSTNTLTNNQASTSTIPTMNSIPSVGMSIFQPPFDDITIYSGHFPSKKKNECDMRSGLRHFLTGDIRFLSKPRSKEKAYDDNKKYEKIDRYLYIVQLI